jgi:hypothetical protein
MKRGFFVASLVLALAACATNNSAYRHGDGSYRGAYNDGYYAAAENGYGDYYYDRPQIVYDDYSGYGYGCGAFGYSFGSPGWGFGARLGYDPWFYGPCGYNAWYGFGYPWGWYQPWPRHHHHHDNDHDADDPPGGWSGVHHANASTWYSATPLQNRSAMRIERVPRMPTADRFERGGARVERSEPADHRSHPRDASQH